MRKPYQVLVFPYKKIEGKLKYAIFLREDLKVWQGIAGGGECGETVLTSAKREAYEEANISSNAKFEKLDSYTKIPVVDVVGSFKWGDKTFLVEEFCFGVNAQEENIKISSEHLKYEWVSYDEAIQRLKWDSNKTALWELNQKLKRRKNCYESTISGIDNTI